MIAAACFHRRAHGPSDRPFDTDTELASVPLHSYLTNRVVRGRENRACQHQAVQPEVQARGSSAEDSLPGSSDVIAQG